MALDWLLVDTLAREPFVVAQGHRLRRFVPTAVFLRRNPYRLDIEQAIAKTSAAHTGSVRRTEHAGTIIRTEPVTMTDGRVHGVQVWTGPPSTPLPIRPTIGAVVWDLTTGVASDTRNALVNAGIDPEERLDGRTFAEDLQISDIHPEEGAALALAVSCRAGQTYCGTWDIAARTDGELIRVGFVSRALSEPRNDGTDHLVIRAMNWRAPLESDSTATGHLAHQILRGMTEDGVYRAVLDLSTWRLLKWLDPPCPHFDWRGELTDRPLVHPEDDPTLRAMTQRFATGPATGTIRLRSQNGWTPMHITACRIALADGVFAGLISTRLALHDERTNSDRERPPAAPPHPGPPPLFS